MDLESVKFVRRYISTDPRHSGHQETQNTLGNRSQTGTGKFLVIDKFFPTRIVIRSLFMMVLHLISVWTHTMLSSSPWQLKLRWKRSKITTLLYSSSTQEPTNITSKLPSKSYTTLTLPRSILWSGLMESKKLTYVLLVITMH